MLGLQLILRWWVGAGEEATANEEEERKNPNPSRATAGLCHHVVTPELRREKLRAGWRGRLCGLG